MSRLTREQALKIVNSAREKGQRPDLQRRQLCGLNLTGLDPALYGKQPTEAEGDETWAMLKLIRQLFEDAGNEHAAVLFTVAR